MKVHDSFWLEGQRTVQVIGVNGAWSTIKLPDGSTKKVRNSQLAAEIPQPPEHDESTEPDHKSTASNKQTVPEKANPPAPRKPRKCVDIGDFTAELLRGKSLDEVYLIASQLLGAAEAELRAKYSHCNPGSQRMSLGNRLRSAQKKEREEKKEQRPCSGMNG
jgi:hypothetical protein